MVCIVKERELSQATLKEALNYAPEHGRTGGDITACMAMDLTCQQATAGIATILKGDPK